MILYQSHNSSVPYNFDAETYEDFTYIPHLHRDPELVCVLEGEVVATVENRTELLRAGDFALILKNQVHSFETPDTSLVKVFVFAAEYAPEFRKLLGNRVGKTSVFRMKEGDRNFLLEKLSAPEPDRLEICACMNLACGEYLRQKQTDGLTERQEGREDLLHKMLTYISLHYTENISLAGMAESLGYEPHYLSRCFHRLFQKNFKQFVNGYRLQHALQLLSDRENPLPVIDVAYASGFQSVRNFNRVYREAEGAEPRKRTQRTKSEENQ